MSGSCLAVVLAALYCLASGRKINEPLLPISIEPGTSKFFDSDGRQRIFHGLNAVTKISPYIPIQDHFDPMMSFSAQDAEYFNEWGLNIVRLGYMWTGVEVSNGTYNETYLQQALDIVNTAAQGGVYSLIDSHQDLFSERFCADGAPVWVTESFTQNFPEPLAAPYVVDNVTGFPSWQDCAKFSWSTYYFTEEVAAAFQALYDNQHNLADSYGKFWSTAANLFKNNSNVIGFELINEPFAGDIFKNPELMLPGLADFYNLEPFYDYISPYIRNIDPNRLVFFEPVTWSSLTNTGELAVGFSHVPGGIEYNSTSVLAWHYYDPPNISPNGVEGYFQRRINEVGNLKSGGMLTEFYADFQPSDVNTMNTCDNFQVSWIAWIYKAFTPASPNSTYCDTYFICPNGTLNYDSIRAVSRTYAQAVAGNIIEMTFNQTSSEFLLQFKPNNSCSLPTEIYLNEMLYYPNGFNVSVSPSGAATWSKASTNYIDVVVANNYQNPITITITRI